MSDDLFNLPASEPTALEAARLRLARAKEAHEQAELANEEMPIGIPVEVTHELHHAEHLVARLESQEIDRLRNK